MIGRVPLNPQVMIVGAGPAGISSWLHLNALAPEIAEQTVVVDKDLFPRDKLCGGGITDRGDSVLRGLDLRSFAPSMQVNTVAFRFENQMLFGEPEDLFRVVRRRDFDQWLVNAARLRGMHLHENERVLNVEAHEKQVLVTTTSRTYSLDAVIGCDGSGSLVRSKIAPTAFPRLAHVLETTSMSRLQLLPPQYGNVAMFDFSCMAGGVQGYTWSFPTPSGNSVGLYDSRVQSRRRTPAIKTIADAALKEYGAAIQPRWCSAPLRWFSPNACFGCNRVLLAGDAAGVDPLMGEGISFALEYGRIAATELIAAYHSRDFTFSTYHRSVIANPLGKTLKHRLILARILYSGIPKQGLHAAVSLLGLRYHRSRVEGRGGISCRA